MPHEAVPVRDVKGLTIKVSEWFRVKSNPCCIATLDWDPRSSANLQRKMSLLNWYWFWDFHWVLLAVILCTHGCHVFDFWLHKLVIDIPGRKTHVNVTDSRMNLNEVYNPLWNDRNIQMRSILFLFVRRGFGFWFVEMQMGLHRGVPSRKFVIFSEFDIVWVIFVGGFSVQCTILCPPPPLL